MGFGADKKYSSFFRILRFSGSGMPVKSFEADLVKAIVYLESGEGLVERVDVARFGFFARFRDAFSVLRVM